MKTKWIDPDCRPNPKGSKYPCCRCQKEINPLRKTHRMVHLTNDGYFAIHPNEGDVEGSLGLHPIGSDCAKIIGIEWTFKPTESPNHE